MGVEEGAQSMWSAVMLCEFRKRWMDRGCVDGMVSLSTALDVRITHWDVGERRSQPRVYLSASFCSAMIGQGDSAFCNCVTTSLRTPMSMEWSCGAVLCRVLYIRLFPIHWQNQLVVRDSAISESSAAKTHGALSAIAWRNVRMSSQSAATPTVASHNAAYFSDLIFAFSFLLSLSDPLSSSSPVSSGVFYTHGRVSSLQISSREPPPQFLCCWQTPL